MVSAAGACLCVGRRYGALAYRSQFGGISEGDGGVASFRVEIQDCRHTAEGIDRELIRGTLGNTEEEDDNKGEGQHVVFDLAGGHSAHTADHVYGIDAATLRSLSSRTITAFLSVSDKWYGFWGLNSRQRGTQFSL